MGLDGEHKSNISFDNPATIYLRGDVNGWDSSEEYKMTYEGEGRYSLKVGQVVVIVDTPRHCKREACSAQKSATIIHKNCVCDK